MTEHHEARKDADGRSPMGRRSYLAAAASAVGLGIAGAGTASAAGEEDFDLIEVPAGGTHTVRLGDGDTLENTLIDITASGATYQITAIGTGWTIRNVGVRGVWDLEEKAEPLIASVPSSDGTARIENVYLGDGAYDDTYPGATGIYVANAHEGVLEIDRVNIQDFPDNAIYGSSPGDLSSHSLGAGGGGEVHITNSYAANCRAGGFRVGTNGSYAKNCVAVGCDRNFWGFYNETEAIDCDFSDGQIADIASGDGYWQADATVTASDTCYGSKYSHSGTVVGESAGTPSRTEPGDVEGVPLSASEAASGTAGTQTSGGDDSGNEDSEGDTSDDTDGHLLAFVTDPEANLAGYEFTADGAVEFTEAGYESPSGGSIVGGTYTAEDFVEEVDGSWRAGGVTGGGYGDAYRVAGPVTSIDIAQSDVMWVELDGERMSVDEVIAATGGGDDSGTSNDHLLAFVTDPEASLAGYEFAADGAVEFTEAGYESPSGGTIEGGTYTAEDFVEEVDGSWRAGGVTGGGYGDAYRVAGPVTSIDIAQSDVMWVELDGERMSVDEVIAATANDDGGDGASTADAPSNVIVIDATESDGEVSYSVAVSGSLEKSTYDGATIDGDDAVDGGQVEGTVQNSSDAYWFSGDITGFRLFGNAQVDVEYDVR